MDRFYTNARHTLLTRTALCCGFINVATPTGCIQGILNCDSWRYWCKGTWAQENSRSAAYDRSGTSANWLLTAVIGESQRVGCCVSRVEGRVTGRVENCRNSRLLHVGYFQLISCTKGYENGYYAKQGRENNRISTIDQLQI